MSNNLTHRGYVGKVEYDDDTGIFHGTIVNTRDVITFQGTSVDELRKAMRDSVDDYLAWAAEDGFDPDKPYSGKFNVRIDPELHREISTMAKRPTSA